MRKFGLTAIITMILFMDVNLFASTSVNPESKGATLSESDVNAMFATKVRSPYLVEGFRISAGYASDSYLELDLLGYDVRLSDRWHVTLGYGFGHMRIDFSGDCQTVSDDALLELGVGAVIGIGSMMYQAVAGPSSPNATPSSAMSVLMAVLSTPFYLWNGSLFVPFVSGDWIGLVDRSHMTTQVITEGFHKKSFTYINDIGLRYSRAKIGNKALFVDGGVRFEKNFDESLKLGGFAILGLSFK